ncbi:3-deoxy-D-manno-octulosonate 8-phosphate phosphatase [Candidatus Bathyarchaeota archaeon]|nr:MAG: 3-deoxy-D-manno-octulosonate 8-phosphate phosphatase [Candidatus Bathyarchaeota archaeon]
MKTQLIDKFKKIKLLLLDVDGILTDGKIILGDRDELKFFDVQDGLGIVLLHRVGINSIIITAKKSRAVKRRAKEMEIKEVYQNSRNKLKIYHKILQKYNFLPQEIAFMGDEIIDLPVLEKVGLSLSVPNAVEEVKKKVDHITQKGGGKGAVREVCDLILKLQGKWEEAINNLC